MRCWATLELLLSGGGPCGSGTGRFFPTSTLDVRLSRLLGPSWKDLEVPASSPAIVVADRSLPLPQRRGNAELKRAVEHTPCPMVIDKRHSPTGEAVVQLWRAAI